MGVPWLAAGLAPLQAATASNDKASEQPAAATTTASEGKQQEAPKQPDAPAGAAAAEPAAEPASAPAAAPAAPAVGGFGSLAGSAGGGGFGSFGGGGFGGLTSSAGGSTGGFGGFGGLAAGGAAGGGFSAAAATGGATLFSFSTAAASKPAGEGQGKDGEEGGPDAEVSGRLCGAVERAASPLAPGLLVSRSLPAAAGALYAPPPPHAHTHTLSPTALCGVQADAPAGVFSEPPPVVTLDEVPKMTGEEDEAPLFRGEGPRHGGKGGSMYARRPRHVWGGGHGQGAAAWPVAASGTPAPASNCIRRHTCAQPTARCTSGMRMRGVSAARESSG